MRLQSDNLLSMIRTKRVVQHVVRHIIRGVILLWVVMAGGFAVLYAQTTTTPQSVRDSVRRLAESIITNNRTDSLSAEQIAQAAWEFRANDPQIAIRYADYAVQTAQEQGYTHTQVKALGYLGVLHRNIGDYFQAIQYFMKTLALSEKHGFGEERGYSLINLSDAFGSQGDYAKAEEYTNTAIQLFTSLRNQRGLGYALGTMGDNCQAQKDFDKALSYYQQAYNVRRLINDSVGMGVSHWRMAQCLNELHRYDEALQNGFAGLFYAKKAELLVMIAGVQGAIGASYLYKQQPALAIQYAQSAFDIVVKFRQKHIELEITDALHKAYAALKQFDKAYQYANHASQIREELKNTASIRKIATMDAIYALDKKELQLLKMQQGEHDQAQVRKFLTAIIVSTIIILIVLGIAYRSNRRSSKLLESKNNALESANEFKLGILRMASHDLKNPLTSIMMNAEFLLQKKVERDPKERKKLSEILQMADRMTALIKELLDSAREMGHFKIERSPFDIRMALLASVSIYQEHASTKSITIDFSDNDTPSAPLYAMLYNGDESRMKQVFDNLISNAVKYTHTGGRIDITLQYLPQTITVRVSDTGQGLTQEDITKMFIPFQQLSSVPTGGESSTGVGLSIIKQIVDAHKGALHVQSEGKDKGTTFTLTLPTYVS